MKLNEIIAGLSVLARYFKDEGNSYVAHAEHDMLYVDSTSNPIALDDLARLHQWGWFQPDVEVEDGERTPGDYDPAEPWAAYV